ncbi:DEAD/DEAH box helicase [Sutcliffiella rhizosphaerae]|uniref:DEAD/DEAH box helicase n=1 Tax=Sutcliffiella rhizosphaerae TaxID=2880967 RepID=UPI001E3F5189|nr:DEAD/DEAH box helicase [Sutcliffiella rhizosphaerae]
MNIHVTQKIIKDRCGSVSFKKGERFHRDKRVEILSYTDDKCEAIVAGTENFDVVIRKETKGGFQASCSCPKLASVKHDCQHIAAVLFTILEQESATELSEGVFRLFNRESQQSFQQRHFEKREVVKAEFACKIIEQRDGNHSLAIELFINGTAVKQIRKFLLSIHSNSSHELFDATNQCFKIEDHDIITELITILLNEKLYAGVVNVNEEQLPISATHSQKLLTCLSCVENATIDGHPFKLSIDSLSLEFYFSKVQKVEYTLQVEGLEKMVIFPSYQAVFTGGQIVFVDGDDCKRLAELKRLLKASSTNHIPISENQVALFLDKVVPGLRRLGKVTLDESVTGLFSKTPLVAKLYLDRVKNRLLASIEFTYDHIIFNPLDLRAGTSSIVIRDREKEQLILDLMEESRFAKSEEGYYLHNEELEYHFLYHIMPKLEKFVQTYATTAVRNRIFRENPKPLISVRVKKERTNWLEFTFKLEGVSEADIRELLAALEEKKRYFRLRNGTLFSLETREFEEIQRFLKEAPVQVEDLEHGLNMPIVDGFRFIDSFGGDDVFSLETSFQKFLEDIKNPSQEKYPIPKNLEKVLRDYQKQGFRWLKSMAHFGFGGILADDMGLGKTLQSIAYMESELEEIRHQQSPVLIVCPTSLTYNWLSELKKFTPNIHACVVGGSRKEREQLLQSWRTVDVLITSYPAMRRDIHLYTTKIFHTVFFDEAQAFKNPLTQTARTVKRITADHKFALTGTPVENALEELWSIFHIVFPELFMGLREYSFLQKKTIARRIRPFMLRRMKKDVLAELPEKQESLETVELLPEQKKLYAAYLAKLRHDTLKHLNKDTLRKNKIRILAGITRLRQICCHPTLFVNGYKGKSAKFELLLQLIDEARSSGRRVLIFSQFTKMLELIGRELTFQGLPFFYLDGKTPSEERVELCERFNAGEHDFFLISLKAGGTGLNLAGADTVILYDLWWNPAVEEQATDRAHRMGQKNKVEVIRLVSRGTVEEKMNELQDKKKHLIEEIIDPDEKDVANLTEEDIREILSI